MIWEKGCDRVRVVGIFKHKYVSSSGMDDDKKSATMISQSPMILIQLRGVSKEDSAGEVVQCDAMFAQSEVALLRKRRMPAPRGSSIISATELRNCTRHIPSIVSHRV
jgi:hypothetical protein